jgi:hypothetical protein
MQGCPGVLQMPPFQQSAVVLHEVSTSGESVGEPPPA